MGFLWRVLWSIIVPNGNDFDEFCVGLRQRFGNYKSLTCGFVSKVLRSKFPECLVVLLVDETFNMGKEATNITHTCGRLMNIFEGGTMIHAIVSSLVGTPFAALKQTGSTRGISYIETKLLTAKTLIGTIFKEAIKTFRKNHGNEETDFLTMIVDTIGLPRLVSFLHEAVVKKECNLGAIRHFYQNRIDEHFDNVSVYNIKIIKAVIAQRSTLEVNEWDSLVVPKAKMEHKDQNEDETRKIIGVTWNSLQKSGLIKIEKDGVYASREVLLKMIGSNIDSRTQKDGFEMSNILHEARDIANYTHQKLFEKLFYLNEKLISYCLNGQVLSYQRYFNMKDVNGLSKNLRERSVRIERLELDKSDLNFFGADEKAIKMWEKSENVIIYPAIDVVSIKTEMDGNKQVVWVQVSTVKLVDNFYEQLMNHPELAAFKFVVVVCGATSAKELGSKRDDNHVVLTGNRVEPYFLPVFRRRYLFARAYADSFSIN